MTGTDEEREAWLQRAAELRKKRRAEADRLDAPRFALQWSRWQREEQDAEEERNHPARVLEAQEDSDNG